MTPIVPEAGTLTVALQLFLAEFLHGYSRLHADALMLLHWLAVIDLGLAALFWMWTALAQGESGLTVLAQKVLSYSFWLWLVGAWLWLAPTIMNGFIYAGLLAGGSTMTVAEFTNPSKILQLGLVATEPLWAHIRNYGWSAAWHMVDIWLCGLCGLLIMGAFLWIAIEMFVFFLQFYIVAVLGTILLPFGINRYTGFLADGVIATLVGHGIKVMVLAMITSVTFPVLWRLQLPAPPTWGQLFTMAAVVWAILILAVKAPHIAVGMLVGGPQLTAGTALATLVGGGMLLGAFGSTMRQSGQAVGSAATRAATALAPERTPVQGTRRPQTS